MKSSAAIAVLILAAAARAAEPPPAKVAVGPEARESLAITVYGNNYGLVRETRKAALPQGLVEVEFQGVAEKIDPTSVAVDAGAEVAALEQDFRYDLASPASLLAKCVGQPIALRNYPLPSGDGATTTRQGTLVSAAGGTIVRFDDANGAIELNPPGTVSIPSLPPGVSARPGIFWLMRSGAAAERKIEASYLANDINWKADYVATLAADDSKLDLAAWATVTNNSGASYKDAKLKLVAGDVQRAAEARPPRPMAAKAMAAAAPSAEDGFGERSFSEYHVYDLGRATTLAANAAKQLSLFSAAGAPAKKGYLLESAPYPPQGPARAAEKRKLVATIEFDNDEKSHLGIPLPKGRVRIYKPDADGAPQLAGEDTIDHTPRGEKVRLKLGETFDVVADRVQTQMSRPGDRAAEIGFKIAIRNQKAEDIEVLVLEHLYGEWEITKSSQESKRRDATTAEFHLPVKAGQESVLTYTARVEF